MTYRGGLSLSIWASLFGELEVGEGGGQISFCPGTQKLSWRPWSQLYHSQHDFHKSALLLILQKWMFFFVIAVFQIKFMQG